MKNQVSASALLGALYAEYGAQLCPICSGLNVIFSDETGQNLNLVKPTQYDGRSHVRSG